MIYNWIRLDSKLIILIQNKTIVIIILRIISSLLTEPEMFLPFGHVTVVQH